MSRARRSKRMARMDESLSTEGTEDLSNSPDMFHFQEACSTTGFRVMQGGKRSQRDPILARRQIKVQARLSKVDVSETMARAYKQPFSGSMSCNWPSNPAKFGRTWR